MFTHIAYADSVDDLIFKINAKVINPAIEFLFIIAFVIFIWGIVQMIRQANNKDKREEGRQHMMWGIVGFLIMFGVWGIINILVNTFGIKGVTANKDQQKIEWNQKLQDIKIGELQDIKIGE